MQTKASYGKPKPASVDPSQCNGCGVCMLSCPVWQQRHTKALTYCGRTRAAIGGAQEEELADSAKACILCGSCEPLCPMGISTQHATIALRQVLGSRGLLPLPGQRAPLIKAPIKGNRHLLLPGRALMANPGIAETTAGLIGKDVGLFWDDGYDIALALEAGEEISEQRLTAFMEPLTECSRLIVSDGLQFHLLSAILPSRIVLQSLGQALLANPAVRSRLRNSDFFVIESRAYNARRSEVVKLYDQLRQETGCSLNLDLLRVAMPTGASSYQHKSGLANAVSVQAQVDWMLEGKSPERIVVEHLDDAWAFRKYTSLPVLHLAEVVLS